MPTKVSWTGHQFATLIWSSFSSAKENGWTYIQLWQNNAFWGRTDDRLESLSDSINSIKNTGASLSQLATNYTLRWNRVFLIPHRETKKIPSYQYHLNRYLKWLLFSALNRRSIQSQPNLGSSNPNQLTIFPELAFPYKTTGRSVFVHFFPGWVPLTVGSGSTLRTHSWGLWKTLGGWADQCWGQKR